MKTSKYYALPVDDLRRHLSGMSRELSSSDDSLSRSVGSMLNLYWFVVSSDEAVTLEGGIELIGTIVVDPEFLIRQQRMIEKNPNHLHSLKFPEYAVLWGREFLKRIIINIRIAICDNKAEYASLRKDGQEYSKGLATAVSVSLFSTLGLSDPVSIGCSTLILLVVMQATKGAFCEMTDEEVMKSVNETIMQNKEQKTEQLRENFSDGLKEEEPHVFLDEKAVKQAGKKLDRVLEKHHKK